MVKLCSLVLEKQTHLVPSWSIKFQMIQKDLLKSVKSMKFRHILNKLKEWEWVLTTITCSQLVRMDALSFMTLKIEIQREKLEKEIAYHSLMRFLPRKMKLTPLSKTKNNLKMNLQVKELKVLKKLWSLKEKMNRSTNFKKTYPALNSNIEIDMIPFWKTRRTLKQFSKRRSKHKLTTSKLNWKKTEILTPRRCLKMQPSSSSSKLKRKKKLETSKRLLLMSSKLITRKLML